MRNTAFAVGFVAVVAGLVAGCSSSVDPGGQTSSSDDALDTSKCSPSDAWWKTQYDDSTTPNYCEGPTHYTNCGPASIAMLRYALTCGESNKTAASMRNYLDDANNLASTSCSGTNPGEWNTTLDQANSDGTWVRDDKYSTMSTTNHCKSSDSYTASELAADMASGAVTAAAIGGDASHGQLAPCGFADGHAIFISHWDGTYFTVYDPDSHKSSSGTFVRCGNSKPGNYKAKWTKSQLATWSNGFNNAAALCVLTGHRTCIPGQTSASGCTAGHEKTCTSKFQWSSCACAGTTCGSTCCPSGDFCGTNGVCCDGTCKPGCPC